MKEREVMTTADGSVTIAIPELNVTYHSKHGAIQESMHVFIEAGLRPLLHRQEAIAIFEMGFGTGLNALLTFVEATKHLQKINYHTVEAFPLEKEIVEQLNYCEQLQQPELKPLFDELHTSPWNEAIHLNPWFTIQKNHTSLFNLSTTQPVNLIYYDAFAPAAQPELWTAETFTRLFNMLTAGGILVTYCSKGDVRRAMQAAGFLIEKIPGPPGKREMVRATKK
ncbi:MAG: tRNA (5-methylaminomethyl-2-thiouridine)(34)-methyltransferase MnmD [Niastella sp.]|nr:tRNA (5-methylaminomethyl-2-thiouridine)(34)-methyltransferase MnmD [Niastella sp.]